MAKSPKKPKRQPLLANAEPGAMPGKPQDRLVRLAEAVQAIGAGALASPRTAKLMAAGIPKMAQKLVEEAAEAAIDAVRGERAGFVNESADLLYNLVVLWCALGVSAGEVWAEMDRREALLGIGRKAAQDGRGHRVALPPLREPQWSELAAHGNPALATHSLIPCPAAPGRSPGPWDAG